MNIAFCVDNNYVPYCTTAIQSIIQNNNSERQITFYITHFPDVKNIDTALNHIKSLGHIGISIAVDDTNFKRLPVHSHISKTTYHRLYLAELLPLDIGRILYLDCDLIVQNELFELFNENLDGYSTGMIPELANRSFANGKLQYNAGVMLIDLNKWREKKLGNKVIAYIVSQKGALEWLDQTAINDTIWEDIKSIDIKWNMITQYFSKDLNCYSKDEKELIENRKSNANIIHFTTDSKPWDYLNGHPYRQHFLNYLKKTPFDKIKLSNKTPKTILKKFRRFIRSKLKHK